MPQASSHQRAERKQQIIHEAFETWGRSVFYHTRLDDVAEALNLTKPALYRYFRSKEDLLQAMERQLLTIYAELGSRLKADASGADPSQILSRFIRDRISTFAEHVPQFFFAMHYIGVHGKSDLARAFAEHMRVLADSLARVPGIYDPATAAGYVRTTVSFFLMRAGLKRQTLRPRPLDESEQEQLASLVERICARGYGAAGKTASRQQMEAIERSCAVSPSDLPPDDPILRAVAETVAEHGFAEASTERIARRAGLTKSSLYFHFRDRDEMFARLIERHQERLRELIAARVGPCATAAQRIYCFLVVLGSYMRNAREIPAVLNWFRTHGYQLRVRHPDEAAMTAWFSFLEDALRDGSLSSHGLPMSHVGSHLSFVVMNHIATAGRTGDVRLADLRQIYDLFMHGTQGVRP